MIVNVLIDTCSWIDLLSEDDNKLLPQLEFWISNNYIKLITHDLVVEEWNKHKTSQIQRFTDSLRTKYRHAKEVGRREKLHIPISIEPNYSAVDRQIQLIDRLFSQAYILSTSLEIKAKCSDRSIAPRKAPFHNKIDSAKDAQIIFSALEYFQSVNQGFTFISSNKSDFGDPDNLESSIHPEIVEEYPEASVSYYSEIGRAIYDLKSLLPASLLESSDVSRSQPEIVSEISIDRTKHILDQVYEYVIRRNKELKFIPIHIYTSHYPLVDESKEYTDYSHFIFRTNNPQFFELFKAIQEIDGNEIKLTKHNDLEQVADYSNKLRTVLLSLSQNLIFTVGLGNKDRIEVRFSKDDICNSAKCSFLKLKFEQSLNSIDDYLENAEELAEKAYVHYLIGNYLLSVENYEKALTYAIENKSHSLAFLIHFNLKKLYSFIKYNYTGKNTDKSIEQRLGDIDLETSLIRFETRENIRIISWIKEEKFFEDAKHNIQKSVNYIIDQYHQHLHGGWSSNNEIWRLINEFAKLESILEDNHIVYDRFDKFIELSHTFFEGIIASYAIEDSHFSRLKYFDDWIVIQLLRFSRPKNISKFLVRYKVSKIKYKSTATNGYTFDELIDNFFQGNLDLKNSYESTSESGNRHYWSQYNLYFENILNIVSICDFNSQYYNSFFTKLLDYLPRENYLHPLSIKRIIVFISRVGHDLETENLLAFFKLALKTPKLHEEELFDSVADVLEKRNERFSMPELRTETLLDFGFQKCNICQINHQSTIIIPIARCISDERIIEDIRAMIVDKLDGHLDFELFYLSTLFEIIELNTTMFDDALELAFPSAKQTSFRRVFGSDVPDYHFPRLDSIINLCFKFGLETNSPKFNKFKELNDYYSWILDMDGFDYMKFDPSWIGDYPTRYYFKRIAENTIIHEKIISYLKTNQNTKLEGDYLNIYIKKTWNKS